MQGDSCIGADCTDTEDMGYNVLRLKDSNLRIDFEDTSGSGGAYSSNDWRLLANGSGSGGGEFFALEDSDAQTIPFRIEVGASRKPWKHCRPGLIA